jgi:RNA polymerase sigma-70 factor (ECF subfamily)
VGSSVTTETLLVPLALAVAGERLSAPSSRLHVGDREAVEACQRGEREAFDQLMERYQRDVYRLCYRYVNNHEDANDMAQEVFIKAYRALGRFRGESSFSTWLYRIAVNTCLNFRASRRPAGEELPEGLADGAATVGEQMEKDEKAQQVRQAVRRLPEKQRATLILKIYHDLTHQEVALILGSTVGTVKANLFHALSNLRRMMAAEVGE